MIDNRTTMHSRAVFTGHMQLSFFFPLSLFSFSLYLHLSICMCMCMCMHMYMSLLSSGTDEYFIVFLVQVSHQILPVYHFFSSPYSLGYYYFSFFHEIVTTPRVSYSSIAFGYPPLVLRGPYPPTNLSLLFFHTTCRFFLFHPFIN